MRFLVYLQYRWYHLLELAIAHALVNQVTVLIATAIGVGPGLATYRTVRPRRVVLSVASVFLTIPSFALFGIMIGVVGSGRYRSFSRSFPTRCCRYRPTRSPGCVGSIRPSSSRPRASG